MFQVCVEVWLSIIHWITSGNSLPDYDTNLRNSMGAETDEVDKLTNENYSLGT